MIRSNTFEKKYPLLAPFITDTNVRNNMLNNKDLMAKYSLVSTDPRFFGLQLQLPNGESLTVLDYLEENTRWIISFIYDCLFK